GGRHLSLPGGSRRPGQRHRTRRRVGHAAGRRRLATRQAVEALPAAGDGLSGLRGWRARASWCRLLFSGPPRNNSGPQYVIISMRLADPTAGLPPTTAEQLPDDAATLKRMILELLASLHQRDRDIEGYRHRIDLLLRRLYGPRGERIDPNQ